MTTEKATTDPKEYSRAEITALNKRKEAADAIRQKN